MSLFSKILPLAFAMRVWDGFLAVGDIFALKAAVAIVSCRSDDLLACDSMGDALKLLNKFPSISEASFFSTLKTIQVSSKLRKTISRLGAAE